MAKALRSAPSWEKVVALTESGQLSAIDYDRLVRGKFTFGSFIRAAEDVGFRAEALATRFMSRSKFFELKKQPKAELPAELVETMLRAIRVRQLANEVFRNREKTDRFMSSPHPALGGRTPLEAVETGFGAEAVRDLLGRALAGVAA
ncbi:MAG: DUF2384 domain-containing protein [Alphaproteobacteria bacterium]|nr:DUF2384 domain-containing protein [Alphaproteobacteria bacterium]